ncbi:uncharacterized protein SCHCODRAFT_02667198 [Schizophyllum commune H4-8]|nr:uncharacterized protein SCHCODRAFT_02667198 [Schizophyllum commune H4-8]KAI5894145.1 hypothetical protein SCHCODRAFT_02667198 [Schizophyllum commune H4-8]
MTPPVSPEGDLTVCPPQNDAFPDNVAAVLHTRHAAAAPQVAAAMKRARERDNKTSEPKLQVRSKFSRKARAEIRCMSAHGLTALAIAEIKGGHAETIKRIVRNANLVKKDVLSQDHELLDEEFVRQYPPREAQEAPDRSLLLIKLPNLRKRAREPSDDLASNSAGPIDSSQTAAGASQTAMSPLATPRPYSMSEASSTPASSSAYSVKRVRLDAPAAPIVHDDAHEEDSDELEYLEYPDESGPDATQDGIHDVTLGAGRNDMAGTGFDATQGSGRGAVQDIEAQVRELTVTEPEHGDAAQEREEANGRERGPPNEQGRGQPSEGDILLPDGEDRGQPPEGEASEPTDKEHREQSMDHERRELANGHRLEHKDEPERKSSPCAHSPIYVSSDDSDIEVDDGGPAVLAALPHVPPQFGQPHQSTFLHAFLTNLDVDLSALEPIFPTADFGSASHVIPFRNLPETELHYGLQRTLPGLSVFERIMLVRGLKRIGWNGLLQKSLIRDRLDKVHAIWTTDVAGYLSSLALDLSPYLAAFQNAGLGFLGPLLSLAGWADDDLRLLFDEALPELRPVHRFVLQRTLQKLSTDLQASADALHTVLTSLSEDTKSITRSSAPIDIRFFANLDHDLSERAQNLAAQGIRTVGDLSALRSWTHKELHKMLKTVAPVELTVVERFVLVRGIKGSDTENAAQRRRMRAYLAAHPDLWLQSTARLLSRPELSLSAYLNMFKKAGLGSFGALMAISHWVDDDLDALLKAVPGMAVHPFRAALLVQKMKSESEKLIDEP